MEGKDYDLVMVHPTRETKRQSEMLLMTANICNIKT
jgi:hypothetical protein